MQETSRNKAWMHVGAVISENKSYMADLRTNGLTLIWRLEERKEDLKLKISLLRRFQLGMCNSP